jgi:peptidoglycan/LPS O-acetylase OafA/YrhL
VLEREIATPRPDSARVLTEPSTTRPAGDHTLDYRPYLDGLRAVAVMMVFAFHAEPSALSGGFIGVDVFFVLSGYLITLILLSQTERQTPRVLSNFYVRRIQRLLPASLTLLVAVALREAIWGSVLELTSRLREVRATTFYVANWNLISSADEYFAESASASPLRHMWSLAVEEQFYLVWPVLVVIVVRLGRGRIRLLASIGAGLAAASVVAMLVLYSPADVARAYYGTDARVFQPLLGALLAMWFTYRRRWRFPADGARPSSTLPALAIGVASLGLLGALAVTLQGTERPYFRGGALAVGLLACAVIWAVEHSGSLGTILGARPLAALGRISYGFYLWHWPIILWLRPPENADWTDRRLGYAAQFGVTVAVATASYVLIERPIRMRKLSSPRIFGFTGAAIAMVGVIVAATVLLRVPTTGYAAYAESALDDLSVEQCPNVPRPCVKYDPGDPNAPTVVTIGDSTAQTYDPAMKALAEQYGFRYVQAAVGGCPIGVRLIATGVNGERHKPSNLTCYETLDSIYAEVLETWNPQLVIATSFNETSQHVTDGEIVPVGTPEHLAQTRTALEAVVDTLTSRGGDIVFLSVLPPGPTVACLDESAPNEGACVRPVEQFALKIVPINGLFADLDAERDEVRGVIDFTDTLCPNGECPLIIDEVVVRYDGVHYTGTQSLRMAPLIDERLRALGIDLAAL